MNQMDRAAGAASTVPLVIASCLPTLLIVGAVLIIAGGFNPGFVIPAIVVGAMVGMLTYVTARDHNRNYPGAAQV